MVRALKEKLQGAADALGRLPAKHVHTGISVAVTLFALAIYAMITIGGRSAALFTFIQNIETRSLDARFRARGVRPHDSRIVIVGVDEKTLQKVGSFPIGRNYYAKTVDVLKSGGAKVIGFDIAFPTPEKNSAVEALQKLEAEVTGTASPAVIEKIREIQRTSDNDAILAESIKNAGNVVLGHIFLDQERAKAIDAKASEDYYNVLWGHPFPQMLKVHTSKDFDLSRAWNDPRVGHDGPVGYAIESNIRILAEPARSYGFFNDIPDRDGTYRRALTLYRYTDREWFPSLALEVVRVYENIKDQSVAGYMNRNGLERMEFGQYVLKTEPDGSALINYAGPYKTYQQYSMGDVLDGTVPPSTFKDKIVLVGPTAVAIGDVRPTPFQSPDYMGVEIHANTIDNILHSEEPGRGFLARGFNQEILDAFFIVLFGIGMGLLFGRLKPLYSTGSVVVAAALFFVVVQIAFSHFGMWLYTVIPVGTLVLNYGAITSFRMITEEREKRKVRKTFERYVSPGVIRLIEKDPRKYFKQGGESRELSIMFSDIRSFTTISESMTPDELVAFLNEYLGEMTDLVFQRWGTLDKYIGDALMAFWGSPFPQADHAVRACSAALDMTTRLSELNLKWEAEGRKPIAIGIGINTDKVNVGNMGSSKRFAWTVMGDGVNLASRLEGQNKEYHSTIIIGENTYQQVREQFVCRDLDRIKVKGKTKPVKIYELMGWMKDAAHYQDLISRWSEAQSAYLNQDWNAAAELFEELVGHYPEDGPSLAFLNRVYEKRESQPKPDPAWDGVFVAKSK
ncbi:MAG: CHASE2 domain-containing protein [Terriglobales bacterium]